jgi:hypothetical protein
MVSMPAFFWQINSDRQDLIKSVKTLSYRTTLKNSIAAVVTLILFLCSFTGLAQDQHRITGTVVNATTGATITSASVFISGTSKGTVTGPTGNFTLSDLPATGSYELVVSSIGYVTRVYAFTADSLPLRLLIELKPKVEELVTVTVEPWEKDGWLRWGRIFTESFIGTTAAARTCTIKNYKAIRFRYSRKTKTLIAVADEPLIIENRALGYRIKYQLEDFIYEMGKGKLLFVGYSLFEDLSEDKNRIPKRWILNRKVAYNGSMMHFMRSLYNNKLAEGGFLVRRMYREPNLEKERVKKEYAALWRRSGGTGSRMVLGRGDTIKIVSDSTDYFNRVMKQPDSLDMVLPAKLTADSIMAISADSSHVLFFARYLNIIYVAGLEQEEYLERNWERRKPQPPVSTVTLITGNPVVVERSGSYFPPQEFFASGYWAWSEKLSHMLPVEFDPEKSR